MDRLEDIRTQRNNLSEHEQRVKLYQWYRSAKERFKRLEDEGNPSLFYTGTSRVKAEEIAREGFKLTKAKTGKVGVRFYGVDGVSMTNDKAAKKSALRHAKYKAFEDASDLALISFRIPTNAIILDDPYYAFYTTQPDEIEISDIQYFPPNVEIEKLFEDTSNSG